MTDDFKFQLRNAFVETALLVMGAIAGRGLGYLVLGDHWVGKWVFPVLGAWLFYQAAGLFSKARTHRS